MLKTFLPTALFFFIAAGFLCAPANLAAADAPAEIAGFQIGKSISEFPERLRMETAMPIRHLECLMEVEVEPPDGYKSGMLYYGTCTGEDVILRVKMKYMDASRKFYDTLLDRFEDRFGKPDKWKGDPFHVVIAWKWFFTDAEGRQVSLILQHNTKDLEEKIGNSVKLTASDLMAEEKACFRRQQEKEQEKNSTRRKRRRKKGEPSRDWDLLVPK
jgi:hypothetical protein